MEADKRSGMAHHCALIRSTWDSDEGIRMAPLIDVAGLTKRYGRKRGITDVSFEVTEGEVFGFLGPNGAGKTTTMRLLMALLYPSAGSARIAGLDCWRRSVDVKRVVG